MIATDGERPPIATVAALLAAASRKRPIVGTSHTRIQVADVAKQRERIERDEVTKSFLIQHHCSPKATPPNALATSAPEWTVKHCNRFGPRIYFVFQVRF